MRKEFSCLSPPRFIVAAAIERRSSRGDLALEIDQVFEDKKGWNKFYRPHNSMSILYPLMTRVVTIHISLECSPTYDNS